MPVGDREVACALVDLRLEPGVGRVQLGGHAIELACKHLELIARIDRDAVIEVTCADLARTLLQGANRLYHVTRKQDAREERQQQTADQ